MAGAAIAVLFPPIEGTSTGIPVSRKVSDLVYSASVERELGQPVDGAWLLPTAVVNVGDATFVLDTGNNRILKLDKAGGVTATLDRTSDERLDLRQPMAMTSDGQRLIVANSLAAQILVLSTSGQVEKIVTLESGAGEETPRPIGVAVTADGGFIVSDANNHRVLMLDSAGPRAEIAGDGHASRGLRWLQRARCAGSGCSRQHLCGGYSQRQSRQTVPRRRIPATVRSVRRHSWVSGAAEGCSRRRQRPSLRERRTAGGHRSVRTRRRVLWG